MRRKVIEVSNLSKYYGDVLAVSNVSFSVTKGEFFGCLGPNGAGKTTLIKILTGQCIPTTGSVRIMGVDPTIDPIGVKLRVGIVPEYESVPSFLTVEEYLQLVLNLYDRQHQRQQRQQHQQHKSKVSVYRSSTDKNFINKNSTNKNKIRYWLDFFDLYDRRNTLCKDLSKGNVQKLMLAAALITETEILFLDEPFINLDPIYQLKVQNCLQAYLNNGGTIFMCTHILEIAEKLCTRVAVLNKGEIIRIGKLSELRSSATESLTDIFLRLVGAKDLARR